MKENQRTKSAGLDFTVIDQDLLSTAYTPGSSECPDALRGPLMHVITRKGR